MRSPFLLWEVLVINIITIICSIPIVTAGAAAASMHYVLYQMIEDKEGHIVRSYMKQFKGNLKSATPIWLIMLLGTGILFFEYSTFKNADGAGRAVIMFVYAGFLFLAMLSVWLFPLTAKFVYPTYAYFRNAFILCITRLLRTVVLASGGNSHKGGADIFLDHLPINVHYRSSSYES